MGSCVSLRLLLLSLLATPMAAQARRPIASIEAWDLIDRLYGRLFAVESPPAITGITWSRPTPGAGEISGWEISGTGVIAWDGDIPMGRDSPGGPERPNRAWIELLVVNNRVHAISFRSDQLSLQGTGIEGDELVRRHGAEILLQRCSPLESSHRYRQSRFRLPDGRKGWVDITISVNARTAEIYNTFLRSEPSAENEFDGPLTPENCR